MQGFISMIAIVLKTVFCIEILVAGTTYSCTCICSLQIVHKLNWLVPVTGPLVRAWLYMYILEKALDTDRLFAFHNTWLYKFNV